MVSRIAKAAATGSTSRKQLWVLRHGQATHNPRAEAARHNGCSHDEFMALMQEDDSLDSELTELGKEQGRAVYAQRCKKLIGEIDLVVSSPLSRAIQTADLAVPFVENRIAIEDFREINGWLLNAQRRHLSELQSTLFPNWNFSALSTETDELWTPELESQADCCERGYRGLSWILQRPEDNIFLVCHGGILRFTMTQHEKVKVVDGRSKDAQKPVDERFGNCELRRYELAWVDDEAASGTERRSIILTQVDFEE